MTKQSKLGEYRFDLKVAKSKPNCRYVFRLMMALNDQLSIHWLYQQYAKCPEKSVVERGVLTYLLRIQASHTSEAYIAFVEPIRPTRKNPFGQDKVHRFITKKPTLLTKFEALEKHLDNPEFGKIRKFRNTFGFHYNHKSASEDTWKALNRLVRSVQRNPGDGDDNLILRTESPVNSRFVSGDRIVEAGWREMIGTREVADFSKSKEVQYHQKFVQAASSDFIIFAESFILAWVSHYSLQVH